MYELQKLKVGGIRVLTSRQIAECYETTTERIKQNFQVNRSRYIEGKHYIVLNGEELRRFKYKDGNSSLVSKQAKILYLWTEKGALLHAKSLNTDKAWEVYDYLVDFYFRVQDGQERNVPTSPRQLPAALCGIDENILAYNRGFLFGVFRAEVDNEIIGLETIYSMLSDRSKQLIHRELLGLEATYE